MADTGSKSGYVGKIANTGAQKVEAPCAIKPAKGKASTKQGNDLRSGGSK